MPRYKQKRGAGRFRDRVEIYRVSSGTTYNDRGQITAGSTLVFRPYADIRPLRGVEGEYTHQMTGTETHAITIRYTTFFQNLDRKHWLVYDGRKFSISAILNHGNLNRDLELICGEDV